MKGFVMKTLPETMMVEHRIPVVYTMRGYAVVKLPITASKDDIEEALEDYDPQEMEDSDLHEAGYDASESWKPEISSHLEMLQQIGAAFIKLDEKHNIAPVANWCCNSDSCCEGEKMLEQESRYIGFAYIHYQNIESLMEYGKTCIGFSARDDRDEDHLHIARMVKAALEDQGLTIKWSGKSGNKLEVSK